MAFIELGDVSIDLDVDLHIDGLTIPKFTWAWIGINIAEGFIGAAGGAIFNKFLNAVIGVPTVEELLVRAVNRISQEMKSRLEDNDLRNYEALLSSLTVLMTEYANNPALRERLTFAITRSQELVELTQSLAYNGYAAYIAAASLRLAVLQEAMKIDPNERPNIAAARVRYKDGHQALRDRFRREWEAEVAAARRQMADEYADYEIAYQNAIENIGGGPHEPHGHPHKQTTQEYNYTDRTFFGVLYDPKPNFDWNVLFQPIDKHFAEGDIIVRKWFDYVL